MIGPNLSEWSLKRPSFIVFLMLLVVAAGVIAFKDLGRDEDPPFTVRTMIVAAAWPGLGGSVVDRRQMPCDMASTCFCCAATPWL